MPASPLKTDFALPLVHVHHSDVHGLGAFAARKLPAGTLLGEYTGRRYTPAQAEKLRWSDGPTYLFVLSDGSMIDGAQGGNATRHLNHACDPNCAAAEVQDAQARLTLTVTTVRAIDAGEELFLDYGLRIDESEQASDYACRCGSPKCRGTMAADA